MKKSLLLIALLLMSCGGGYDIQTVAVNQVAKPSLVSNITQGRAQRIIILGDSESSTPPAYWPGMLASELEKDFPGKVTFLNLAVRGTTSETGIAMVMTKEARNFKADLAFLEWGLNDAYYDIGTGKSLENLGVIIGKLREYNPDCEIIIQTSTNPSANQPHLPLYYEAYRAYARDNGHFLIDYSREWKRVLTAHPEAKSALIPDDIHPSEEGTALVMIPVLMGIVY